VRHRWEQEESWHSALVRGFCGLAEFRDPDTGAHLDRLAAYAQALAQVLAHRSPYASACTDEFIRALSNSVPLHDIGKVGIPDRILLKPGPLTAPERAVMQTHTVVGGQLLKQVCRTIGSGTPLYLSMAVDIARFHHERWDGNGYPQGLVSEQIPLAARITAIADVYDALSSPRVYRRTVYTADELRSLIVSEGGRSFDPVIVEAFLAAEDRFREIRQANAEAAPSLWSAPDPSPVARGPRASILVVDDEPAIRRLVRVALERVGYQCDEAESTAVARDRLRHKQYDIVTLDIRMPEESGIALLTELAPRAPQMAFVMLTAETDVRMAIEAMRKGAYDYIIKPVDLSHLRLVVDRVLERQQLEQEAVAYRARLEQMVEARTREMIINLSRGESE
jgi:response regulator RpfG family c-di-GMP phosphodiesterase